MAVSNDERDGLKQYLLGEISEDQRQRAEQRMLTDDEVFEELEILEDELIDEYLAGELPTAERQRFEQHFLTSPERHHKLRFARALIHQVPIPVPKLHEVPWTERVRLAWQSQRWLLRAATVGAVVVVIAALFWFVRPQAPQTFATLTLTISNNDRAQGGVATKLKLPLQADALRLRLELPETASNYRVELLRESGETQNLKPVEQNERAAIVVLPAAQLSRGQYALNVYAIKPDGTEQRIKGSYLLTVE